MSNTVVNEPVSQFFREFNDCFSFLYCQFHEFCVNSIFDIDMYVVCRYVYN